MDNRETRDPVADPTILDAEEKGRAVFVIPELEVTLEGLSLIHGNAVGLEGGL